MKCARNKTVHDQCALSVDVLVSVLNVQCHASGEVRCSVVISVVIGICLIVLSVPLVQFYFSTSCLDFPCCDTVSIHPTLSRSHSFTYVFTVFSRHFRCGICTHRRVQWTAVSCKRSNCNKVNEFKKIMP